jgi:hypothetical protein
MVKIISYSSDSLIDLSILETNRIYRLPYQHQLVFFLLTSFSHKQISKYKSFKDWTIFFNKTFSRLLKKIDPLFAAKTAIYASCELGMRINVHLLIANLAPYISGNSWAKSFYTTVIMRPDDMADIIELYWQSGKKPLPAALSRGFAKAFDKFDNDQITRYNSKGGNISLIDIVNLIHPKPIDKNRISLKALINGNLSYSKTGNFAGIIEMQLSKKIFSSKNKINLDAHIININKILIKY